MAFHGPYTENILNIQYNQMDHPAAARAAHGDAMHVLLQQTLASRQPPFFFAMIFVSQQIQRPTFIYIYIYIYAPTVFFTRCVFGVMSFTQKRTPTIQTTVLVLFQSTFVIHIRTSAHALGFIHS